MGHYFGFDLDIEGFHEGCFIIRTKKYRLYAYPEAQSNDNLGIINTPYMNIYTAKPTNFLLKVGYYLPLEYFCIHNTDKILWSSAEIADSQIEKLLDGKQLKLIPQNLKAFI